eukprot:6183313-Pleurochrysis_carterae.AAC.3
MLRQRVAAPNRTTRNDLATNAWGLSRRMRSHMLRGHAKRRLRSRALCVPTALSRRRGCHPRRCTCMRGWAAVLTCDPPFARFPGVELPCCAWPRRGWCAAGFGRGSGADGSLYCRRLRTLARRRVSTLSASVTSARDSAHGAQRTLPFCA